MSRTRPRNVYRKGDHLVTTADGDVIYASQAAIERYGPRKGLLVDRRDLDDPGRADLPQRFRSERQVEPVTGPPVPVWRVYDENGDVVPGGPADT
jgi:hypothetical protein